MLLFAVLSGFLTAIPAPLIARRYSSQMGWLLALLPAGLTAYFLAILVGQAQTGPVSFSYPWVPGLGLDLSLRADGLSLLFALMISGIGALVFVYAGGYFDPRQRVGPIYTWLLVFMAAMLGVVLADNLLLLYVFWELTSLSSYLLIGFEHERPQARAAALQALLVTGAGGLALLAGLALLGQAAGTYQISAIVAQGELIRSSPYYLPILGLILLGAFTKSAQFPFHFWLPGAMEAPTPVSAYLHSATMVKAGIYLLARFHSVLGGTEVWQYSLIGVGLATMLVGAYLALNHTDLKLILAYSTVSALGTIVLLLGMEASGAVKAAMVFLLAHGMYKGALFMIAGSIQHETGTREVEELGGLRRLMPYTAVAAGIAGLSLAGFGPVLGFIGKELLFESILEMDQAWYLLAPATVAAGAVNVAVALILLIRPFFGPLRPTPKHPHPAPLSLWLGPILLAGLGLLAGLAPEWIGERVISPAVTAILGKPYELSLALWHGINPALGMSLIAILLGIAAYFGWTVWRTWNAPLEVLLSYGPQRWYLQTIIALNHTARRVTRVLQNGYLRYYLLTIMISAITLTGITLFSGQGVHWPDQLTEIYFYEAVLCVIILVATVVVVRSPSRLSAIAALGVVGYSIALIFLLFGAPDLAMTQFLIESLTVVLFVLAFYHLPHFSQLTPARPKFAQAIISLLVGGLMSVLAISAVGINFHPSISQYYIENSASLAHGRDIVNIILVDFRGIDTLGEITVLAIAAVGVFAMLKLRIEKKPPQAALDPAPEPVAEYQLETEDAA